MHLKRAVAKDCGENGVWEVGDDRQQDCHAGCDKRGVWWLYLNMINNNDDKEQTHNLANWIRNVATLFILATWTLGDHVAPDQKETLMLFGDDDNDYD